MKYTASFGPIAEKVMQKHPELSTRRLTAELVRISQISSDARQLVGKRILDLGSGSITNADRMPWLVRMLQRRFDPESFHRFAPWYCRIVQETGAQSFGIDIADNSKEEFSSFTFDLTDPAILDQIEDDSFHAVNNYFLTVPRKSKHAAMATSPAIMKKFNMDFEKAYKLNDQIFQQVQRILENGGTYTLAEFVFRKRKGKLQLKSTMKGLGS